MKSFLYVGIGILLGLALILAGWQIAERNYSYQGSQIDPPVPAADFELIDQNGEPFQLSEQRGQVVLIFFGYGHCPDVCPVTLSTFKRVKEQLGEKAEGARFVFITVDPERDTPEELKAHLANFDSSFVGLSGDQTALQQVWKDYGVYVEKREADSAAGYLMDHSSIVYAIDKQGNWRLTFPFGMEAEVLARDVEHLLNE